VTGDLKKVWNTPGFADILNVEMLPYGNAQGTTKVQCQHGPQECAFNMIEACGIEHLKDAGLYMPFIFCIEGSDNTLTPAQVIEKCAPHSFMGSITTCFGDGKGTDGSALIAQIAAKTKPLNHQYTPWVLINGNHSVAAENNLEKAICTAYTGSSKPAACAKHAEDNGVLSTSGSKRCEKNGVQDLIV